MTMSSRIMNEWLTVEQAAEYLAFPSRAAVYQAVRRGQIPAYRIGKRLRFRRRELDKAFQRCSLIDGCKTVLSG